MLLISIFVLGYLAIVFEHQLKLTKSASALLTGVLCWTAHVTLARGDAAAVSTIVGSLGHQLSGIAQILFFLLGAMTIVELIDAHDGFELITARIHSTNRRKLLVAVALLAFFLSAILDNLTTSIVMTSLVRKLMDDEDDQMRFGGVVIVAANAGGAFSPIGDVTTTMLWIGGAVTATKIMSRLFVPSLVSLAIPVVWVALRMKGNVNRASMLPASVPVEPELASTATPSREPPPPLPTTVGERVLVLSVGIGVFLMVPVFKTITHLPPVMGILLGLAILWTVTEFIHKRKEDKDALSVAGALQRVDAPSILFFLGILLAIGALESEGILPALAQKLDHAVGNINVITLLIGLSSSVVDNVPLVAAVQAMYPLSAFPTDDPFWIFLAYCAGTGGSILIIGSAAGIAVMGIQRITFGWYFKHLTLPALLGYLAGALAFFGMEMLLGW